MTYDLGSVVAIGVQTRDGNGTLADVGSMALTITLPDGTTTSATPAHPTTGSYTYDYTPSQAGRHVAYWVATGQNATSYTDVFDVRDPADLPVVGLADAKAHLNVTVTTYDAELRRFLDVATDLCESYTGRSLRRRTVTEALDGGRSSLVLRQAPVLSVTSVVVDGTTMSDLAVDLPNGIVYTDDDESGIFTPGRQTITVTYVAGWAAPPADVQQAVLETLRHLWTTQRGGMDGRNPFAGDEYAAGTGWSLPRRVIELLQPYVIKGV